MAIGGGVQPRVVALRLDVAHLRSPDETSDAAELDRDRLVVGLLGIPGPLLASPARTASANRPARTGFIT